jgi:RNA polymerase sigma-70 factor, ECF subfamily
MTSRAAERSRRVDDDLVKRSASGDAAARDELVSLCLPRVYRTVYLTCGAAGDAEDLVQTAILQALEKLGDYRGPDRFCAWLDRLTVNVVRQHFRRFSLRFLTPASDVLENAPDLGTALPDRRVEVRRTFARLAIHLSKIKPKNREALVLSLLHGYTAQEIAEICGCTAEAAWKRCRRGYRDLDARLGRDPGLEGTMRELMP